VDRLLEATFQAERDHFWFKGFRQFVTPLIERAVTGVSHPRILDCGCGTGANLTMLRRYGDAYGFDLTAIGVRYAHDHFQHRVARASATHVPFASRAFDLVTSFDVLYCLQDEQERQAIAEMARLVKTGGGLIVNVAALEMLRGGHSILSEEVRRYTKPLMRQALSRAQIASTRWPTSRSHTGSWSSRSKPSSPSSTTAPSTAVSARSRGWASGR